MPGGCEFVMSMRGGRNTREKVEMMKRTRRDNDEKGAKRITLEMKKGVIGRKNNKLFPELLSLIVNSVDSL